MVLAQELFYNTELRAKLRERGWVKDALALQIIGEEHQAWDMPGLSPEDRSGRMHRLHAMLLDLFGGRLHDVVGIHKSHLGGFPRELLFAWLSNIDSYKVLCREHPGLVKTLVQHSLDTDDLETSFGMLKMRCRSDVAYNVAVRSQEATDHLFNMRRLDDDSRGFSMGGNNSGRPIRYAF